MQRRGSEGSEVDARKSGGVLAQLLDKVRHRDRSKEGKHSSNHPHHHAQREYESDIEDACSRERAGRKRGVHSRNEVAERLIDRAAATFDASAVPERPKSACESTLLRAAEKLYSAAAAARPGGGGGGSSSGGSSQPSQGRRSSEKLPGSRGSGARSRESSGGRTRSAEREKEVRSKSAVPPSSRSGGGLSVSEVRAIVHVDPGSRRQQLDFSAATVPRKSSSSGGTVRKENIYENIPFEAHTLQHKDTRPIFRKQSSLDTIPRANTYRKSEAAVCAAVAAAVSEGNRRGPPLRKADSFEGHEEAVRTLVAAVQENRILRRKKTK